MVVDIDWLIQTYAENVPNRSDGAWEDLEVVRNVPADKAQDAVQAAVNASGATGRVRCSRWDHVREFNASPGPAVLADRAKAQDTPPPP